MRNKLIVLLLGLAAFLILGGHPAAAADQNTYITYANQTNTTVDIRVYFTLPDVTGVKYAVDKLADGSGLDWKTLTVCSGSGSEQYADISAAEKYRNYFIQINSSSAGTSNIRIYPVDTVGFGVTDRVYNDYAHGYFRPDTPMCTACHNTHSALKEQLLLKASYYQLCMLCHSSANTQSKYDVESGLVTVAGGMTKPSLGGPFLNQAGTPVVSRHDANITDTDTASVQNYDVPGSDVLGGKQLGLTCLSCHYSHGGASDNYRLLKRTIAAANGSQLVTANVDVQGYAVTASSTSGEELIMLEGNTEFCAACHLDYDEGNAVVAGGVYAASVTPGPGTARFRHPVTVGSTVYSVYSVFDTGAPRTTPLTPQPGDVLPLQYYSAENPGISDKRTAVVCSTCHFAHGSVKSFNVQGNEFDGRYMLRLNNYGVCQSCHQK